MIRDLKSYRDIRLNKFSGRDSNDKDQLMHDLIRDLVEVEASCGLGIYQAFKRELHEYLKALGYQSRAHYFASVYGRIKESYNITRVTEVYNKGEWK